MVMDALINNASNTLQHQHQQISNNDSVVIDEVFTVAWKAHLFVAYKIILIVLLAFIMLAMGCHVDFVDVRQNFRRPWPVLIGMLCQFVLLPLASLCFALVIDLPPIYAVGLIFITTCPGGTTSNLFAYWAQGDVPLSVTMTSVSTAAAFAMMPLNLFIYTRPWTDTVSKVPFLNILTSLISIVVPLAVGMVTRIKLPSLARVLVNVGGITGIVCVLGTIVTQFILYPQVLVEASWKIWFTCITLPYISGVLGYALSAAARLSHEQCRTVYFETACQNFSMATAIVVTSFPAAIALRMQTMPMLYGPCLTIDSIISVVIYRMFLWFRDKRRVNTMEKQPPSTISGNSDTEHTYKNGNGVVHIDHKGGHI